MSVDQRSVCQDRCGVKVQVCLLVNVANQLRPVEDAARHVSTEDVVELVLVRPGAFHIIDLEFDVWRDPVQCQSKNMTRNQRMREASLPGCECLYHWGWTGLKSLPRILAKGQLSSSDLVRVTHIDIWVLIRHFGGPFPFHQYTRDGFPRLRFRTYKYPCQCQYQGLAAVSQSPQAQAAACPR